LELIYNNLHWILFAIALFGLYILNKVKTAKLSIMFQDLLNQSNNNLLDGVYSSLETLQILNAENIDFDEDDTYITIGNKIRVERVIVVNKNHVSSDSILRNIAVARSKDESMKINLIDDQIKDKYFVEFVGVDGTVKFFENNKAIFDSVESGDIAYAVVLDNARSKKLDVLSLTYLPRSG